LLKITVPYTVNTNPEIVNVKYSKEAERPFSRRQGAFNFEKIKVFNEATIQARNVSLEGAGGTITALIVSTIWKKKKPR
jgi:hypothetical protein